MRVPHVDIVVPVRNEERDLAPSVRRLVAYLRESFPFRAQITIADNGSTDATWVIADRLARELPEVRAVRMELPGRGRALRAIWSQSEAEVFAYMDVDLSTDLNAPLPPVAPLLSRPGAGFARGSIRVPQLRGPGGPGARAAGALPLQIARFTVIGVASTIAYVALFLLFRLALPAQAANVVSLLLTAMANIAANRRLTFGISGRSNAARHQVKGLIAFGLGLALTSGSLAVMGHAGRLTEICVLLAANLVATVIRFLLYRYWVFGRAERPPDAWAP